MAGNTHGFLLSGGVYTTLDFPLAKGTEAIGINDSGVISGTYTDTANVNHGFTYSNGSWGSIDVAGAASTTIFHIQNSGAVEGWYTDDKGEDHGIKGQ
jgi:hypothetical protein